MRKKQQSQQKQPKPTKPSKDSEQSELTFIEHIYELRSRLFWVVLTVILASAVGFQFKDQLIAVVMAPLHGQKLVYLTPGGGFGFIFTLVIYFGLLFAIPVIVYHVYKFLQPLLQRASRRLVAAFMVLSCVLAAAGAAFGYFVTIPAALDFLATFAGDAVTPNLTADSYLNFVVAYVLGLALLFQLPLLLFLFDHVRPFPPGSLSSSQRLVIIGATIVAAIITPTPDAFNMAIVAVPIIAMYQLGVIAVYVRHRALSRRHREQAVPQKTEATTNQPLTDIVKELELSEDEAPIAAMQPIVRQPVPAVAPTSRARTKVVDGFVRPDQARRVIVPASRSTVRPSLQTTPRTRPARSLDGFTIASYSSNS